MFQIIRSHLISFRYIYNLIRYNQDNPPVVQISNEKYIGLNNEEVELKIFHPINRRNLSVIIFPGASPFAEEHPGMINLASIIAKLGYQVYIPRIPPLKSLNISRKNIDWFAHAYQELLKRSEIDKNNVTITGISYGGSLLLKASLDKRMLINKPKSLLIYGSAYEIDSGLKFLFTGEIVHNDKTISITPNEWGVTVILHNYLHELDVGFDTTKIREILTHRVADNLEEVSRLKENLNPHDKEFVNLVLSANYNHEIKSIINKIIDMKRNELQDISPKSICNNINHKVFIMHGANDSMVPFTESVKIAEHIKNSELLISYLYEHKEISTNSGIFSKLKELIKMQRFFASYFKYNES